jgi:hypothetical protein
MRTYSQHHCNPEVTVGTAQGAEQRLLLRQTEVAAVNLPEHHDMGLINGGFRDAMASAGLEDV